MAATTAISKTAAIEAAKAAGLIVSNEYRVQPHAAMTPAIRTINVGKARVFHDGDGGAACWKVEIAGVIQTTVHGYPCRGYVGEAILAAVNIQRGARPENLVRGKVVA
jgi:hypothetical protein